MRHGLSLILSAALIAVLAADASAQERSGGWFGVGGGWGSANLACDECGGDSERQSSGVIYFNGGYTVNERLLAGAEFNLWTKTFEDPEFGTADVNFYNLLGTVTAYPAAGRFFIKGGAGVGFFGMDLKMERPSTWVRDSRSLWAAGTTSHLGGLRSRRPSTTGTAPLAT